jgi:tetratricopeptide (TPR) repeat protein
MYDQAISQFQLAINLKNDYANAYYNLGHAYESKQQLDAALAQYQMVKQLVAQNPDNSKKISSEIDALQSKIGQIQQANAAKSASSSPSAELTPAENQTNEQPLSVNKPPATLPERKPAVKIPGPSISPLASPEEKASPAPQQR